MSNDAMDADDGGRKNEESDNKMDVCEEPLDSTLFTKQSSLLYTSENELKSTKSLEINTGQGDSNLGSVTLSPIVTNSNSYDTQQSASNEQRKSVWKVKSPVLVHPCPHAFTARQKSHENNSKHFVEQSISSDKAHSVLCGNLGLIDAAPSAFKRKEQNQNSIIDFDIDGSILKRCNSAPILNDPE